MVEMPPPVAGRGRLAIRSGFTPTDCERVTVPQHDFGGMQYVCGIKSPGRVLHVAAIMRLTSK
jgi:hypothetical protein